MTIKVDVIDVLAAAGFSESRSQSRRMIAQRAVKIEGFVVTNIQHKVTVTSRLEIEVIGKPAKTVMVSELMHIGIEE